MHKIVFQIRKIVCVYIVLTVTSASVWANQPTPTPTPTPRPTPTPTPTPTTSTTSTAQGTLTTPSSSCLASGFVVNGTCPAVCESGNPSYQPTACAAQYPWPNPNACSVSLQPCPLVCNSASLYGQNESYSSICGTLSPPPLAQYTPPNAGNIIAGIFLGFILAPVFEPIGEGIAEAIEAAASAEAAANIMDNVLNAARAADNTAALAAAEAAQDAAEDAEIAARAASNAAKYAAGQANSSSGALVNAALGGGSDTLDVAVAGDESAFMSIGTAATVSQQLLATATVEAATDAVDQIADAAAVVDEATGTLQEAVPKTNVIDMAQLGPEWRGLALDFDENGEILLNGNRLGQETSAEQELQLSKNAWIAARQGFNKLAIGDEGYSAANTAVSRTFRAYSAQLARATAKNAAKILVENAQHLRNSASLVNQARAVNILLGIER